MAGIYLTTLAPQSSIPLNHRCSHPQYTARLHVVQQCTPSTVQAPTGVVHVRSGTQHAAGLRRDER